jgi:hypothetical protein
MIHRVVLGSILLSSLVHGAAWACSCIGAPGNWTEEAVAEHELVVYGEILSVRRPIGGCGGGGMGPYNRVRIEVIEAFAGADDGEVVTFSTSASGASCGIDFQEGERWVVFAAGDGPTAILCGPSDRSSDDDPRLDSLRDL